MTAPRQTVSYLQQRFREVGLTPNARHGQNFLIDLNLVELLVRTAQVGKEDVVLEIGTGTGSLTAMMAPQAAAVVTVELDTHLHQMASELLIDFDNVVMLQQDALKNKNNIHANVLEAVQQQLEKEAGRRLKLVANLPYNVATPVISNLLMLESPPHSLTVTIQKELADRITARPGRKDYNALSVWVQSLCRAETVRIMPPSVFWPRPKVTSAIIQITPQPRLRKKIPDLPFYHAFVRGLFIHRRKFLRSGLLSSQKSLEKPQVDEIMAELSLGATSRAEELDIPAMQALCEAVRTRIINSAE